MASPDYRIRRATLDDLGALKALWKSMGLPVEALEKRLIEFQVAEDSSGRIVAAFGFQIQGRQGHVHSEAFEDFTIADEVRPLFWQRIQPLAMNHGITRLWTQEKSPYWSHNGFQPASGEILKRLPETWTGPHSTWRTLQLKDEEALLSVDKEMAILMEAERLRTKETLEKARTFKTVFTALAFLLAFLIFGMALFVYLKRGTFAVQPH